MNLHLATSSFTCVVATELCFSTNVSKKQRCAFQGSRFATLLVLPLIK